MHSPVASRYRGRLCKPVGICATHSRITTVAIVTLGWPLLDLHQLPHAMLRKAVAHTSPARTSSWQKQPLCPVSARAWRKHRRMPRSSTCVCANSLRIQHCVVFSDVKRPLGVPPCSRKLLNGKKLETKLMFRHSPKQFNWSIWFKSSVRKLERNGQLAASQKRLQGQRRLPAPGFQDHLVMQPMILELQWMEIHVRRQMAREKDQKTSW